MGNKETSSYLAKRLGNIKPSPTLAVVGKAQALKASGIDIISLAAGEPDFDTPNFVKEGATEAIRKGFTKYTAVEGIQSLKNAICAKLNKYNELQYSPSQIIVSNGGKQVIFNALAATLNSDDEVIIPSPYWVSYPDITLFLEGKPVFIETNQEECFKVSSAQIEQAITPRTKWIILNYPNNPTGTMYSALELETIAACLRKHPHVMIMLDEIYEYLVYDGLAFTSLATLAPDLVHRILIVNGVSKSYSMTGWRIGYGAGPQELIEAMAMIQSQSTSNACSISQYAALKAMQGSLDFLIGWRKSFQTRRDKALEIINQIPGLYCGKPEGAFYLFINCSQVIGKRTMEGKIIQSDNDFCLYLLEKANVATVPGSAFGLSPYFRISYVLDIERLEEACLRIKNAVENLI